MNRTLRITLADGREIDLASIAVSDGELVPVADVVDVRLAELEAPAGPGWGPGLQDEDAATAASEQFSEGEDGNVADRQQTNRGPEDVGV